MEKFEKSLSVNLSGFLGTLNWRRMVRHTLVRYGTFEYPKILGNLDFQGPTARAFGSYGSLSNQCSLHYHCTYKQYVYLKNSQLKSPSGMWQIFGNLKSNVEIIFRF